MKSPFTRFRQYFKKRDPDHGIQELASTPQIEDAPKRDINYKVEGALAWPGRDKIDPRAPYFLNMEVKKKHGNKIGYYDSILNFHRIFDNQSQLIPLNTTYDRHAWSVGVAANPWRSISQHLPRAEQRLAHWAIYMRPQDEDSKDQLYYILGMNFLEEYKGELILEDIWGTPGADGKGEWKKRITSAEFKRVKEPGLEEMTVYASYEEFVLVFQLILRQFVHKLGLNAGNVRPHPGNAYKLLSANCQHFSRAAMKEMKKNDWGNPARSKYKFDLKEFQETVVMNLSREREDELFFENAPGPLACIFKPILQFMGISMAAM